MAPLSLLIKPSSSKCNLQCRYCFYKDLTKDIETKGMMTIAVLEQLVKNALEQADDFCNFAFQGGEPTLVKLEFYRKLVEFQIKYNYKNLKISNCIQTNGILIDNEWAKFFADNNFLVGLSLDGNKEQNDLNRFDANKHGSYNDILSAVKLFDINHVKYNILCVVTKNTARHISKVYDFFKKNKFKYLQFITCLDPLGEERGQRNYSLTPVLYGEFLKALFDMWYNNYISGDYISVRQFDNYINIIMGKWPDSCAMSGTCTCCNIVEADGSIYPCDFYVTEELKLGNFQQNSFVEMQNSNKAQAFIAKSKVISEQCGECQWYRLCRCGCMRDRKDNINYYCESYKDFFHYAYSRMLEIARSLQFRNN